MLARAIREGVAHDGRFLNPAVMPYDFYRAMSDEDVASVIVYLRSIPPVRNNLPLPKTLDNLMTRPMPFLATALSHSPTIPRGRDEALTWSRSPAANGATRFECQSTLASWPGICRPARVQETNCGAFWDARTNRNVGLFPSPALQARRRYGVSIRHDRTDGSGRFAYCFRLSLWRAQPRLDFSRP